MSECYVEVFARVTGFFRPVQDWNPGKKSEFKERKKYDLNKHKEKDANIPVNRNL